MSLIRPAERERLLANGRLSSSVDRWDLVPVVRLRAGAGWYNWLLSELHPDDEGLASGLAMHRPNCEPTFVRVRLSDLGPELDRAPFRARFSLAQYRRCPRHWVPEGD